MLNAEFDPASSDGILDGGHGTKTAVFEGKNLDFQGVIVVVLADICS